MANLIKDIKQIRKDRTEQQVTKRDVIFEVAFFYAGNISIPKI